MCVNFANISYRSNNFTLPQLSRDRIFHTLAHTPKNCIKISMNWNNSRWSKISSQGWLPYVGVICNQLHAPVTRTMVILHWRLQRITSSKRLIICDAKMRRKLCRSSENHSSVIKQTRFMLYTYHSILSGG